MAQPKTKQGIISQALKTLESLGGIVTKLDSKKRQEIISRAIERLRSGGGIAGKALVKKRQKTILQVLKDWGGVASARHIAKKVEMNINAVSRTLGALLALGYVEHIAQPSSPALWRITLKGIHAF